MCTIVVLKAAKLPLIINHEKKMKYLATMTLATLVLTGCASVSPGDNRSISTRNTDSTNAVSISAARQDPSNHAQREVHWGGIIERIENRENTTWIEVVERPLNRVGQPHTQRLSGGRFFAVIPQFLDSADYHTGAIVTVTGTLQGIHTRAIGDTIYDYPKVAVSDHTLWLPSSTVVAAERYNPYYAPYRGRFNIGIGRRNSIGFGFSRRLGRSAY